MTQLVRLCLLCCCVVFGSSPTFFVWPKGSNLATKPRMFFGSDRFEQVSQMSICFRMLWHGTGTDTGTLWVVENSLSFTVIESFCHIGTNLDGIFLGRAVEWSTRSASELVVSFQNYPRNRFEHMLNSSEKGETKLILNYVKIEHTANEG